MNKIAVLRPFHCLVIEHNSLFIYFLRIVRIVKKRDEAK